VRDCRKYINFAWFPGNSFYALCLSSELNAENLHCLYKSRAAHPFLHQHNMSPMRTAIPWFLHLVFETEHIIFVLFTGNRTWGTYSQQCIPQQQNCARVLSKIFQWNAKREENAGLMKRVKQWQVEQHFYDIGFSNNFAWCTLMVSHSSDIHSFPRTSN
jgi:hypothetical protein